MGESMQGHVPGRFVSAAGTLHHVVVDEGPRDAAVVVFSSGLGGAWYDWDAVVPQLVGRATLVRFDRPGLGWSQPSPDPPTLAGEAARIKDLLAALDLPGPCVVVGHSLAGFHAEAFARLHPELTAGLVLVDGSAEPDALPAADSRQRLERSRAIGGLLARTGLSSWIGPAARQLAIAVTTAHGPDPADPADVTAVYRSGRAVEAALIENTTYPDLAAELLVLRCERSFPPVPLTVLAAFGASRLARLASSATRATRYETWRRRQAELAELSPFGELIELPDSAHFVPFDRPDAVADAVLAVLSRVSRNSDDPLT
jgi:pimeloyl-ACP methyl ester carboxylesterase